MARSAGRGVGSCIMAVVRRNGARRVQGHGIWLVLSAAACSPRGEAPAPPTHVALDPKTSAPSSPVPPRTRFWTAERGLRAHDLDGRLLETRGSEGDDARRLSNGTIVLLSSRDDGSQELVRMDASGEVRLRVALPYALDPTTCEPVGATRRDDLEPMSPQSGYDFSVDETQRYACIELLDRNENMASYGLSVVVDLERGNVDSRVTLDIEGQCAAELRNGGPCEHRSVGAPWVEHVPAADKDGTWVFDVDEKHGWITRAGALHASLCADGATRNDDEPCAEVESRSPSGRWILLSAKVDDSDYIYREAVLFDRERGELWQVFEEPEGTRVYRSIEPMSLFEAAKTQANPLRLFGESDFAWLPMDRLWVDGGLLIPERLESVRIGGRLARTLDSAHTNGRL